MDRMADHEFKYDFEKTQAKLAEAVHEYWQHLVWAQKEIETRDKKISDLEGELATLKAANARYCRENARSGSELSAAVDRCRTSTSSSSTSTDLGPTSTTLAVTVTENVSTAANMVSAAEYAAVVEKAKRIYKRLQVNQLALERVTKKAQEYKASCNEWKAYADKCNERRKSKKSDPKMAEIDNAMTIQGHKDRREPDMMQKRSAKSSAEPKETKFASSISQGKGVPPTQPLAIFLASIGSPVGPPSTAPTTPTTEPPISPETDSRVHAKLRTSAPSPQHPSGSTSLDRHPGSAGTLLDLSASEINKRAVDHLRQEMQSSQATEGEQSAHYAQGSPKQDDFDEQQKHTAASIPARKRKRSIDGYCREYGVGLLGIGTPDNPVRVKEETPSSPTMMPPPSDRPQLMRTDTLDLDEVGDKIETPRKHRQREAMLRQARALSRARLNLHHYERSASVPRESTTEVANPDVADAETFPSLERSNSDTLIKLESETYDEYISRGILEQRASNRKRSTSPVRSDAVSGNEGLGQPQPRTSAECVGRARPGWPGRSSNAISYFTEDGSFVSHGKTAKPISPTSAARSTGRLSALLYESTPPVKHPVFPQPTSKHSSTSAISVRTDLNDLTTKGLFCRTNGNTRMETAAADIASKALVNNWDANTKGLSESSKKSLSPLAVSYEQQLHHQRKPHVPEASSSSRATPAQARDGYLKEPKPPAASIGYKIPSTNLAAGERPCAIAALRRRPVEELALDDFIPNQNAKVYSYYQDRSRDSRRYLPACTDAACPQGCWQAMRALASTLAVTVPYDGITTSLVWEQLSDSEKLLRWHLGSGYNDAGIASMSDVRRDELVFTARTKLVADLYCRHRVNPVERQKSPPGFWRTEMPTTQELAVDREEAKKLEFERVKERWREAMREGGLWKFKDE